MIESTAQRVNIWNYVVLVCMTLSAAFLTELASVTALTKPVVIESFLILIAGFKIVLVTEYFMELHYAPKWLRGLMATWVTIVVVLLIGLIVFFSEDSLMALP